MASEIVRATCEVLNAACSFGRVCSVSHSFCPRRENHNKFIDQAKAVRPELVKAGFVQAQAKPEHGKSGGHRSSCVVTPLERNVHVTSPLQND